MNLESIKDFKENGIIKVKNFLEDNELQEIKKIIKFYFSEKGGHRSYFSTNPWMLIKRILKLDFKKFKDDIIILNLAKNKKLNLISNKIFNKKSYLKFIDGYCSPISDKDVLPWHTDQAYQGDEKIHGGFVNPDHAHVKFFLYLTDVGPNNGCTSYIPKSHKLGYSIRKGIFNKTIKYQPYFSLKEFRDFISKKENSDFIKRDLNDENIIEEFLNKTNFMQNKEYSGEFDFSLKAGDAIIFDEGGFHKGSKSLLNERMVLRYLYSIKK